MSDHERWLARRVGFVQGRLTGAGHALGLESEMPPEAQAVVREALADFAKRWPGALTPGAEHDR